MANAIRRCSCFCLLLLANGHVTPFRANDKDTSLPESEKCLEKHEILQLKYFCPAMFFPATVRKSKMAVCVLEKRLSSTFRRYGKRPTGRLSGL
uniref:Chemokine interleukin-8-like domain-containing protein n=1 Tax=Paramormyrops kingsleyae TaxID=1676925 RepID=A0A3B3QEL6_9TELE